MITFEARLFYCCLFFGERCRFFGRALYFKVLTLVYFFQQVRKDNFYKMGRKKDSFLIALNIQFRLSINLRNMPFAYCNISSNISIWVVCYFPMKAVPFSVKRISIVLTKNLVPDKRQIFSTWMVKEFIFSCSLENWNCLNVLRATSSSKSNVSSLSSSSPMSHSLCSPISLYALVIFLKTSWFPPGLSGVMEFCELVVLLINTFHHW